MTEREDSQADVGFFNETESTNEKSGPGQKGSPNRPTDGASNDHQLLGAYAEGDEQAFETLVEKYFRMVYTVAARQTGDSHLAEEIAQSVFLLLSRKAQKLSSRISIPGWLLRTTRFVSRDAIKMRHRRDQNERKLAVNLQQQLETPAASSTLELLLEEAIQALRPEEQAGIVARFFEGKNFQEMAEMFAITEDAARKRTARCLAKLQAFMRKRGASVSLPALSGLLLAQPAHEVGRQTLQFAIQGIHAAWNGKMAASHVLGLANHTAGMLRWRFLARLSLRLALPALTIFIGAWAWRGWNQPVVNRIDRLGTAWGALDQRVARHRQFLIQTPPTAPNYQAVVQEELGAISGESSRIIRELNSLLVPPEERTRLAAFLTAEVSKTLNLEPSRKAALYSYVLNRLSRGATLHDAMKALAQTTQTEATEIKAMISPEEQQLFDQTYGADGVLLFSYAKAVALGEIGQ